MIKNGSNKVRSYTRLRTDVIGLIKGHPVNILDVGCSNGALLGYLKKHRDIKFSVGIDNDDNFIHEAVGKADKIVKIDLDTLEFSVLENHKFDTVILADVLEHTKQPDLVLSEILKFSEDNAQIIVSLPNVQHWTAIKNLIAGRWPKNDRGLFDKSHLHFFTLRSIRDLAEECGLTIEVIHRNYRICDVPNIRINRLSKFFAFWPIKPYLTYQYVVRMRRS